MKFGINPSSDLAHLSEYCKLAERYGFHQVWLPDTNVLWADPYVCLSACALSTSKLRIGTGITNPFTRHPAVTANATASLDVLSNGRVTIGIGRGDNVATTLGREPATVAELKEAVKFIKNLHLGKASRLGINGKEMKLRWTKRDIPIYVAGNGPRILQMSGEVGDGAITVGSSSFLVDFAKKNIEKGRTAAGRELGNFALCVSCSCAIAKKPEDAIGLVRSVVATHVHSKSDLLLKYYLDKLPLSAPEDINELNQAYNVYEHGLDEAKHGSVVKEWMVDTFSIAGTADDCIEKISRLEKAGVEQIIMPVRYADVKGFIETFGSKVIPHFS